MLTVSLCFTELNHMNRDLEVYLDEMLKEKSIVDQSFYTSSALCIPSSIHSINLNWNLGAE